MSLVSKLIPSAGGTIHLLSDVRTSDVLKPVVLIIPGFGRYVDTLLAWHSILQDRFSVAIVDLPGHGKSTAGNLEPSVENIANWIEEIAAAEFARRPLFILGESIGGLIALAIGSFKRLDSLFGICAVDPPMTMKKLWTIESMLRPELEAERNNFLKQIAFSVFGLHAKNPEANEERIYYDYLLNVQVPTLILSGDIPMHPVRTVRGLACVFDEVDEYVCRKFESSHIKFQRIPNAGHLLLGERPEVAAPRIIEFIGALSNPV